MAMLEFVANKDKNKWKMRLGLDANKVDWMEIEMMEGLVEMEMEMESVEEGWMLCYVAMSLSADSEGFLED